MKNNEYRKIEKDSIKMGEKACKEYIENGAIENLKGASRAYNTAIRASFVQIMYKNQKK